MLLSALDDRELVVEYVNGSEAAFETLLLRHKNQIYNYIFIK